MMKYKIEDENTEHATDPTGFEVACFSVRELLAEPVSVSAEHPPTPSNETGRSH
jgi:hypothetical protein